METMDGSKVTGVDIQTFPAWLKQRGKQDLCFESHQHWLQEQKNTRWDASSHRQSVLSETSASSDCKSHPSQFSITAFFILLAFGERMMLNHFYHTLNCNCLLSSCMCVYPIWSLNLHIRVMKLTSISQTGQHVHGREWIHVFSTSAYPFKDESKKSNVKIKQLRLNICSSYRRTACGLYVNIWWHWSPHTLNAKWVLSMRANRQSRAGKTLLKKNYRNIQKP